MDVSPVEAAGILGGLIQPRYRADPYPLFARAHGLGPVLPLGPGQFLVVGYEAVRTVLRDPAYGRGMLAGEEGRLFTEAHPSLRWLADSLLDADPPDHSRMRRLMSAVFSARRIAMLEPAIATAVDRLIDAVAAEGADGGPVDFMDRFAFQLPVSVICELLGVPVRDRARFRPLGRDLTATLEMAFGEQDLEAADEAAAEVTLYFRELIAERRENPADDLISALVVENEDGELSDGELLGNLILLLVAGFETTTNLLGNGLALLFAHPEVRADLNSGAIAVTDFTEEVLRCEASVQLTSRLAKKPGLELAGLPVPEGSETVLLLGAANRDPSRYPDPDRFDPRRPDNQPLSFGAGAHYCLGAALARLESATAFRALLRRLPELGPAPGHEPERLARFNLRGYRTLPVLPGTVVDRGV
jgi:cytochrome P450